MIDEKIKVIYEHFIMTFIEKFLCKIPRCVYIYRYILSIIELIIIM